MAFDAGIRQIHLHAAGQKTAPILDPASRVEVPEHAGGIQRLSQLRALEQTIQRRGWQHRFLVAITDEPFIHHEETFAAAVDLVHQAAPSVRTVEAVETEYLGKLDVYVPKLSHLNLWYSHFDKMRREQGGELWFYTCCHPAGRYPNRFLDQSLLKVRVLHWINYLYDLQGYLHWGLNYYGSDNPFTEDGISKDLPLGDRAIVYPGEKGILGSLRFSAQRDGLQDYEYLRTLEDRLRRQRTGGARRFLAGSAAAVVGTLPPCDLVVSRLHTRSPRAVGHAACHRGGNRDPADRTVAGGADLATGRDSDPRWSADGQRPRSRTAGSDRTIERRARAECVPAGISSSAASWPTVRSSRSPSIIRVRSTPSAEHFHSWNELASRSRPRQEHTLRNQTRAEKGEPSMKNSIALSFGMWGRRAAGFDLDVRCVRRAQMTTGSDMEDFAKTFGISAKGWSVQQTGCSLGANVLWPGDEATFTFFLKPGQAYKGPLKVDVIQYGTKGKPGDWWKPVVFKIADTSSSTVEVDLPAEGGFVTVKPQIGDAFGGYALIFDLGERGRAFGGTCVRVPAPEPGRERLPTYAMDLGWPHEMSPVVFNVFKRLGVKGARTEGGYNTIGDAHVDWAMENDLTLMLTVGCGDTPRQQQPLGRGRPWLNAERRDDRGRQGGPGVAAVVRSGVQALLKDVLIQHGWPKGPVNAVELWNEPWEGVSISGWGADMPALPRNLQGHGRGRARGAQGSRSEGAHRRRLLLGQHPRQALLRWHRHLSALARFRQHPLPAARRRSGAGAEVDEPPGRVRPRAGLGHRKLGGQLG